MRYAGMHPHVLDTAIQRESRSEREREREKERERESYVMKMEAFLANIVGYVLDQFVHK